MFLIKKENIDHLPHNIKISELNSTPEKLDMSQPGKVIHLQKVGMLSRGERSSIKITNVKSIKPPDPELVKKQEEERLRTQLQKEIVSRSRTCANKSYECTLPVVGGRVYCARHILNDSAAPYKQCLHINTNGTRCTMPAPSEREQGLCFEHARASLHARQRSTAPPPPVTTTETLLNRLQHYVRPERTRTTSCASSVSVVSDPADQEQITPSPIDPFKDIDARAVNAAYSASIMECGSGTESECDSVTIGQEDGNSDTETAPCEELPLWKAGVYTAEEAVTESKNVLKCLRTAYIHQMGTLIDLLQCSRVEYIEELRTEKEQYCSINSQARSGPLTVRERRQLRKLKAYAGYHRKHGVDAVLARKLYHKRAKVNSTTRTFSSQGRCTFTEGGVRCTVQTLPAAKHCMKHILDDRQQVLFTACGDQRGSAGCREVVARLPLPSASCRYHTGPPAYTTFTQKKEESLSSSFPSTSDLSREDILPDP